MLWSLCLLYPSINLRLQYTAELRHQSALAGTISSPSPHSGSPFALSWECKRSMYIAEIRLFVDSPRKSLIAIKQLNLNTEHCDD